MQFGGRQVLWDTRKTTSQMEEDLSINNFLYPESASSNDLWPKDLFAFEFHYLKSNSRSKIVGVNLFSYFQTSRQNFIVYFCDYCLFISFFFCRQFYVLKDVQIFQCIFFDIFGFFDFVQVLQNFKLDFFPCNKIKRKMLKAMHRTFRILRNVSCEQCRSYIFDTKWVTHVFKEKRGRERLERTNDVTLDCFAVSGPWNDFHLF